MIDLERREREIREGNASLGRMAEASGYRLAAVTPKTLAAAIWGGARPIGYVHQDTAEVAARGALATVFGVARRWDALIELAESYGEPAEGLREAAGRRGARYLNTPAWALYRFLRGAERALRQ